ncbi:MAG: capsular biosynthesis protein CpsI [Alphaproteobacteria bacterium CG_4_9_14_3_um_filter_47_13]|nr:MAG: capsular biosynthesis protein CpsI [Alphaproteobacteria bacterium CG_4_9_14_3_um_filter_47_13]
MKKILITGAAGFIGFHVVKRLCAEGYNVYGIDNMNDYYDTTLKKNRLAEINTLQNFIFSQIDLADSPQIESLFKMLKPSVVINLAAQAGVRYSLENPQAYINSNLVGFANILEGCRHNDVEHLIFASSSSVYGANTKLPYEVQDNVDHPVSLYAATKKANELMAHSYAHLYGLPCTGLRFFTVYGPWGRPDMAYYKFTKSIYENRSIDVYNYGDMKRDFTYIDDIIESILRLIEHKAQPNPDWSGKTPDPATSYAPYRLYNIGNNTPVSLIVMIETLENLIGIKAKKNMLPMQPGDVYSTFADTLALEEAIGFKPATSLEKGLDRFVAWYQQYFSIGNLTKNPHHT